MAGRTGIATWNFAEGTLAQRIDRFAGMGFNAISLILRDALALASGETPDVEEAISRHDLRVSIHGGLAPRGESIDTHSVLSSFRSFVEWHARTGMLETVNFDAAKTADGVRRVDEMRAVLAEMLSVSEGAGFTIGIEDWPLDAEQMKPLVDLARYPHFGILIDLGHLNLRLRKGSDPADPFPVETARESIDRIVLPVNELHVHNNDGTRDMHAPPTLGTADLSTLGAMLKAKGVDCISTIELVPAWCGLTEAEGFECAPEAMHFWLKALS